MGKTIFIAFLVIFGAASAQAQAARAIAKPDSAYAPYAAPVPPPEQSRTDDSSNISFTVKVVPGTSKKFNIEMVSPKSGYAEISLLNSRGDQILILHKGNVKNGINTFRIDSAKVKPGLYYVVSKYEGGLQVADKFTLTK